VIVNKTHPISPSDFTPEIALVRGYQVASVVAAPLERMLEAAEDAGLNVKIASAFRSFEYQESVHAQLVAQQGDAAADAVSARAGYSEHQTGLAVDIVTPSDTACAFEQCFAGSPAGRWLAGHAWEFGFIVRYTAANEATTGYAPEPWHLRFVGRDLAEELHRTGVESLEEFFAVSGGDYPAP
jgi:D-alanyl-D-alanine carboxypeptidase